MELAEMFEIVTDFVKNPRNASTMKILNEWFPNFNDGQIIYNISQHPDVWKVFVRGPGTTYKIIFDALDVAKPESVILYFAELGLYRVYDNVNKCYDGCQNIKFNRDMNMVDDVAVKLSVYQIVLINQPHKLVFLSNDTNSADSINNIRKYVKDYFKSDITYVKNGNKYEITVVDKIAQNREDAQQLYEDLYCHINTKNPNVSESLQIIPVIKEYNIKHIKPMLTDINNIKTDNNKNDVIDLYTDTEFLRVLKSIHPGGAGNVVINGNVNIHINNGVKQNNRKTEAINWISQNLPGYKESTVEYYDKYKRNRNDPLMPNQFGPCVREQGYDIVKGHNNNYWLKRS
jgi:hypothetical protein